MRKGKVYLVGAGPGDPGLMTIRGMELLQRAEVVIYDYLANPIFLQSAPESAELVYVGKTKGLHYRPQEDINTLLVNYAAAGKMVVRLKGGDPYIFGRGGEEASILAENGIDFEVVPGITAAIAAAAYAGIPLTHRDFTTSLGLITGHENPEKQLSSLDWKGIATSMGTLVFYMGMTNLPNICHQLTQHGRDPKTPVAVIRWATTPQQETCEGTLETIVDRVQAEGIKPPALVIVGGVVSLRNTLRWYDKRPLFGKRILITRAKEQSVAFAKQLTDLGAEAICCPMIETVAMPPESELDRAIEFLSTFNDLILTSAHAVEHLFAAMKRLKLDARALAGIRLITVGPKTAQCLEQYGLTADLIPDDYRAEGVVEMLIGEGVAGRRIIYPRADISRDVIIRELSAAGAEVCAPVAYRNIAPESSRANLQKILAEKELHAITFTSSSTVDHLIDMVGVAGMTDGADRPAEHLKGIDIFSIGPLTSETVKKHTLELTAEAEASTVDGLIESIVAYYQDQK